MYLRARQLLAATLVAVFTLDGRESVPCGDAQTNLESAELAYNQILAAESKTKNRIKVLKQALANLDQAGEWRDPGSTLINRCS